MSAVNYGQDGFVGNISTVVKVKAQHTTCRFTFMGIPKLSINSFTLGFPYTVVPVYIFNVFYTRIY